MKTLYEILEVSENASQEIIEKAYRVLAKKYHPDMNPGDAEAEKKFKEASEAYAVLSDPDKKRQYDQFGHAAFEGGMGGGAGGFDFSGMDMGDIFGSVVRQTTRTVTTTVGREIGKTLLRGLLGGLFGGRR